MYERMTSVEPIRAYTKDNVPVQVTGDLFHRVTDAEAACYQVGEFEGAVVSVGRNAMRSVTGRLTYEEIISNRVRLCDDLRQAIGTDIAKWGIECTRFEIQTFEPLDSHAGKILQLQMEAERKKRAVETVANGERNAAITRSEGVKQETLNKAQADAEAITLRATADKNRVMLQAEAQATALAQIAKTLGTHEAAAVYLLHLQRLTVMEQMAASGSTVYLPADPLLSAAKVIKDLH
jgi:regulator of protease activity HflC (stomatin/prohibitin superfamily)